MIKWWFMIGNFKYLDARCLVFTAHLWKKQLLATMRETISNMFDPCNFCCMRWKLRRSSPHTVQSKKRFGVILIAKVCDELMESVSLATNVWPRLWKIANITPLPEVDTPTEYGEFCGINVTQVIFVVFNNRGKFVLQQMVMAGRICHAHFSKSTKRSIWI